MNACKTGDKYKEGVACQTKFTTAKANSPLPMTRQILSRSPVSERPTMSHELQFVPSGARGSRSRHDKAV